VARRWIQDEPWDDESEDEDWESDDLGLDHSSGDDDVDPDEDEPTIHCPYCRRQIHEDAPRCPYCEQYISREDAPPPRKSWFIVAGTIVTLYILYRWIVG
jgi:hypothetical protein